jgi:phosphatidylserine decarboxylase precursor
MGKKTAGLLMAAAFVLGLSGPVRANTYGDSSQTQALIILLDSRPDLRAALTESLQRADWAGVTTIPAFVTFLNETSRLIPTSHDIYSKLMGFSYMIDESEVLKKSAEFQSWAKGFVSAYGDFLDTTESVAGLATFYANPAFKLDEFFPAPSGWLTFNQFFARSVKPGKRPIAGLGDHRTIVSPADGIFQGVFPIDDTGTLMVKGVKYRIKDLLKDSQYADQFAGGVLIHSFQEVNDYHWYHVPFDGQVVEKKLIPGYLYVDIVKLPDGTLTAADGTGFQLQQQRGLLTLRSQELGLVAVLPIGMGHVGSVVMTPDIGATLHKGEEFGFFQFGGSDVITLFQKDRVHITAEVGKHLLQGEAIGTVAAP